MTRLIWLSLWRGFGKRCPACGQGHLLSGYLTVAKNCGHCHEDFSAQRADDAPPYFTILIVGHIVIPAMWVVEKLWSPDMWWEMAAWPVVIVILSLWLLPRVKGAIVGLQWATRMHGFGETHEEPSTFGPK